MPAPPIDPKQLPYRKGVGICLFNAQGLVLVAERRDRPGAWQMPQGGVQQDEIMHTAALREMKEEIGTDNAIIIAKLPDVLRYEFPDWLQWKGGVFRGKYRGQEQIWFGLRYLGQDSDIRLENEHEKELPEFVNWRWVELAEAPRLIVDFKRPVYDAIALGFASLAEAIKKGGDIPPWKP